MLRHAYKSANRDFKENLASSRLTESRILTGDLENIWSRSRDMERNSSVVSMIERRIVDHACAPGLTPKCNAFPPAEAIFAAWAEEAGIDGTTDLLALNKQIVSTQVHRDVLLLCVDDKGVKDETAVRTRVQLIDGARVRTPRDFLPSSANGTPVDRFGRRVINGVSYSAQGRELGWWVAREDGTWSETSEDFTFYPRFNRFGFWVGDLMRRAGSGRPDQTRTLPLYQACIDDILDIEELKEAGIGASFAKNLLSVLLETADPGGVKAAMAAVREGDDPDDYGFVAELEDRSIATIPRGTTPHVITSSGSLDTNSMIMAALTFVSGSCGIPRPILLQDMSGLNFSTSKMAYELFYKLISAINESNAKTYGRLWYRILAESTVRGVPGVDPREAVATWIGVNPIPETDPAKYATAIGTKVGLGLTAASLELAKNGLEFEDVVLAKAEEELILQRVALEKGVPIEVLRGQVQQSAAPAPAAPNDEPDGDDAPDNKENGK